MLIFLGGFAAWLIGGLLGAVILGALWPGPDVRAGGSGNPGASNALRVRGKVFALLVLLWDVGKAVAVLWFLPAWVVNAGADIAFDNASYLFGLLVVAGHLWPLMNGFKGGKGVATALGLLLLLTPGAVPWALGVWLFVFLVGGYSSLASVMAALVLPMWAISIGDAVAGKSLMAFCMMLTALLLGAHRENLQRLLRGEENRFELPWFKPRR